LAFSVLCLPSLRTTILIYETKINVSPGLFYGTEGVPFMTGRDSIILPSTVASSFLSYILLYRYDYTRMHNTRKVEL